MSLLLLLAQPDVVEQLRPTVQEVALLERTRTVGESSGGLGGDTGPGDLTTFTDDTRPTASEVDALIDQALPALLSQLHEGFAEAYYARARHLVALYTAILIEGSYFRESGQGTVALWQDLLSSGLTALNALIDADVTTPARGSAVLDSIVPRCDETGLGLLLDL